MRNTPGGVSVTPAQGEAAGKPEQVGEIGYAAPSGLVACYQISGCFIVMRYAHVQCAGRRSCTLSFKFLSLVCFAEDTHNVPACPPPPPVPPVLAVPPGSLLVVDSIAFFC